MENIHNNEIETDNAPTNFVHQIIDEHNTTERFDHRVQTRFPPEPNGYLHIGHAKSIWLNFTTAKKYGGKCNLRFDDTNPAAEDIEFVEAIKDDIKWLGYEWDKLCYASSYFDKLYDYAIQLIKKDLAYVCSLTGDEVREYRGNHTTPGRNSPYRDRSIEENLKLFAQMKEGKFKEGEHALRVKLDMASGNMNLRDPLIYRIRHIKHPMTGKKWCVYPLYDFTHGLSDAIENVTHSICTLEFEDHRPLYDWFLKESEIAQPPQQIEFSKLQLNFIALSKRRLKELVENNLVNGWDDPRMPTIRGLRRRGYTANSIKKLCEMVGVTKSDAIIDLGLLEDRLREDLNDVALRRMAILNPLKVTITNYPEDKEEILLASNHPKNELLGKRQLPFSRELFIDHDDFMEEPEKKYFRLKPGGEVRLRNAYIIKCEEIIKNESGNIIELKCTYDDQTLGKKPEGRKVKGIIHWVSQKHAIYNEVRLYDRLYTVADPTKQKDNEGNLIDYKEFLNPDSLQVLKSCPMEPSLAEAKPGESFQFERVGYFCLDQNGINSTSASDDKPDSDNTENLVFNRSVTLRDSWGKATGK